MASCSSAQSFRQFLFAEVCENLTPKDVRSLAYSQNLPPSYLQDKDGPEVLLKLEELNLFSESNLAPLAGMMKAISRKDLAKKVDKFIKNSKSTCRKNESVVNPDGTMLKQCQLASNIRTATFVLKVVLKELKEVRSGAREIDNKTMEVESIVAISLIEKQLKPKLMLISDALFPSQFTSRSRSSTNSSSRLSSTSEGSMVSEDQYQEISVSPPPPISRPRSNAVSQPESCPQQPVTTVLLQPQEDPESHDYDYVVQPFNLPGIITPQNRLDESKGQMVTGKDGPQKLKQKPPIAPKPTKKQTLKTDSQGDLKIETADTSTGDSGFEDASKFMKNIRPKPLPRRRNKYTPLKAEHREEVGYYTTPYPTNNQSDCDRVYEEISQPLYVNYPIRDQQN